MIALRALLPAAWLLAGCTALPPRQTDAPPPSYPAHAQRIADIKTFALNGRIAVLTEKKGFSGGMRWHHHTEGDEIGFYSPIGTQLGQLSATPEGVTLKTSDQKTYAATDAETLTQQTLGWRLPMAGLHDWVLGRPATGESEVLAWDTAGHIQHMRQQGWDIEYPLYTDVDGRQLPGKVILKSPGLDVKLVVEQWVGVQTGE